MNKDRLLVLDVNGLLVARMPKNYKGSTEIKLKSCKVKIRPHCLEFLNWCFLNWTVAFFSSTTEENGRRILDYLLTPKQKQATLFMWWRDKTALDPDWKREGGPIYDYTWSYMLRNKENREKLHSISTVKHIDSIIYSPVVNRNRRWNKENTLICDDSIMKLRFNPKRNCVIVSTYTGVESEDLTLLYLPALIEQQWADLQSS